jgi:ubiquinone/menaquinone biosynthesis C-methylase UbiE
MNDRVFKHTSAHQLEDPERLKWMPPAEVLSRLHLKHGFRVADVGAGTGFFSLPMARAVGADGHIFAVDLQQEMLDLLATKLQREDAPTNISLQRGPASKLPLADNSVDVAFYANVWHEFDDYEDVLREAMRVTIPNGRIAVLDWRHDKESPPGPPQDHRVAADAVVDFLQKHGCHQVSCYNVGQYSYLVTAELAKK